MTVVSNLMNPDPKRISHDSAITEAADRMKQARISSLLVEKDGDVIGIVTDTDIVRKAVAARVAMDKEKVTAVMSKPVVSIEGSRSPEEAFDMMGEIRSRHLAVMDKGKVVGVLSVRDLLLFFKKQSEPQMGID